MAQEGSSSSFPQHTCFSSSFFFPPSAFPPTSVREVSMPSPSSPSERVEGDGRHDRIEQCSSWAVGRVGRIHTLEMNWEEEAPSFSFHTQWSGSAWVMLGIGTRLGGLLPAFPPRSLFLLPSRMPFQPSPLTGCLFFLGVSHVVWPPTKNSPK